MIRVEDTDRASSTEASMHAILRNLAWLGITWDDGPEVETESGTIGGDERNVGPYFQSERLDIYQKYIDKLVEEGKAYPAFETTEEIAEKREQARAEKKQYKYDRAALQLSAEERQQRIDAGAPHVIRFKVPDDEDLVVNDTVLGEVRFRAGETEDFVIRKADGYPTYHFAVVVDDELMGVTHVLRGQEHLNNTPKHVALQKALGFNTPVYAHMPLIFNDKGQKMSKRERDVVAKQAVRDAGIDATPVPDALNDEHFETWMGDKKAQLEDEQLDAIANHLGVNLPEVSVEDFRKGGYLPEVIVNFIALLGWTPPKDDDGARSRSSTWTSCASTSTSGHRQVQRPLRPQQAPRIQHGRHHHDGRGRVRRALPKLGRPLRRGRPREDRAGQAGRAPPRHPGPVQDLPRRVRTHPLRAHRKRRNRVRREGREEVPPQEGWPGPRAAHGVPRDARRASTISPPIPCTRR